MNLLRCLPTSLLAGITALFAVLLLGMTPAWGDSLLPKLDIGKGGHCVRDPKFMRANHMYLILHQRDLVVRQGIRGSKYELTNCVDCHASKVNNSVLGTNQNFCQGCHVYAAVKIDCFECHSSKPQHFPTVAEKAANDQIAPEDKQ
jgi:hypothetical protein